MTRFYQQPHAHRFGNALKWNLEAGDWTRFDCAVAWVRRSGVRHLESSLRSFLKGGGRVRFCVGVDLQSTSYEGLNGLLSLASHGDLQIYVHHNESASAFHPKVYLFSSQSKARLIVGSSNLTEGGLYRNVEAGLEIDGDLEDSAINQAATSIEAWTDPATGLAKRITPAVLDELRDLGYVRDEADLAPAPDESGGPQGDPLQEPMFASQPVSTPRHSAPSSGPAGPQQEDDAEGQVLLMRVRTARGTQVQFPIRLVRDSAFFRGVDEIISTHNGEVRGLHPAHARGQVNTLKVEIPETAAVSDPVLRLERTDAGISYQVRDASSPQGRPIMDSLRAGRISGETVLTLPNEPERSTWWRFV